jgi:hypothetical protein
MSSTCEEPKRVLCVVAKKIGKDKLENPFFKSRSVLVVEYTYEDRRKGGRLNRLGEKFGSSSSAFCFGYFLTYHANTNVGSVISNGYQLGEGGGR